jgi:NADH:ubiquinone oxidoreductase subunit K
VFNYFLGEFVNVSVILFVLGLWGLFVMRHNLIIILMMLELILLAVTILFVTLAVLY